MRHILPLDQFLNEGRNSLDTLAGALTREVFLKWTIDFKAGKSSSTYMKYVDDRKRSMLFDLEATIHFKGKGFEILNSTGADGRDTDDEGDDQDPYIIIDFAINPEWLPGEWSTTYFYLADVMRHEIEHITQDGEAAGNYRQGKPIEDDTDMRTLIKMGLLPKFHYLMLPKEVDANLQGLRYEAKKRRVDMSKAVSDYLDTQDYLTDETRAEVMDLWRKRAKKIGGIPTF